MFINNQKFKKMVKGSFIIFCLLLSIRLCGQSSSSFVLDMVHHNPGEPLTISKFNNPNYLKKNGYNGQVINDFTFAHAALTFDALNKNIFPDGSPERAWVLNAANTVRENIKNAHKAGLKVYYFTDIIVLPKKLVELYHDEIVDEKGKISFERPKTVEIHRLMLNELFDTFPDLDGLVIRTGETYLNNVPYHMGNGPITNGATSHIKLINLLKNEVCVKRGKMVFYRTWSFGGMHDEPDYYLKVTNSIETHPNLVFSIKHTKGDYHRTFDFNPNLGLGKHQQIVEVQCQREYEGKGAFPNYVMNGVINGFEEYSTNVPQKGNKSLNDIKNNPNFKGVWSWSRGGGWVGPYITNEFWCKLNAYVISHWAQDTNRTEEDVFNDFMTESGIKGDDRKLFRELCLLSAKAVLRGHSSASLPFDNAWVWWTRDEFLGGIDIKPSDKLKSFETSLYGAFDFFYKNKILQAAVDEKFESVKLWEKIVQLSEKIKLTNKEDQEYLKVSAAYGLYLHKIIASGWEVMALGFIGDKEGNYDKVKLVKSINNYDKAWKDYEKFKLMNKSSASLYKPYGFVFQAPNYHEEKGMDRAVDNYRNITSK